jgi:hypothetical protein
MKFYRDTVTEQSWRLLQNLMRQYQLVVIGGWAVWLYTGQLKSKDIDVVVDVAELGKLRQEFEVFKNERLKKYEFRQGEVEVDIYMPFYSAPGIAAERILEDARVVEGFKLPSAELLWILKAVTWIARRGSGKGRKDLLDLISLLELGAIDKAKLEKWVAEAGAKAAVAEVVNELQSLTSVEELGLNQHRVARAKRKWLGLLQVDGVEVGREIRVLV